MLDAMLNGQTVLLASQMEKAVEVVATKVEQQAGPLSVARSGGRKTQRELAAKIAKLTGPKNNLGYATQGTVQECAEHHFSMTRQTQELNDSFEIAIRAEQQWSKLHKECTRSEPLLPFQSMQFPKKLTQKTAAIFERMQRYQAKSSGILKRWWSRLDRARVIRLLKISKGNSDVTDRDLELMIEIYKLRIELEEVEAR